MTSDCDADEGPRRKMPDIPAAGYYGPGFGGYHGGAEPTGRLYYGHFIPPPALPPQLHRGFDATAYQNSGGYSSPTAGYQYQERGREVGVDHSDAERYELWLSELYSCGVNQITG